MHGKTFKEYFLRAVALLGLLAVLLLGAWGIIQIAFFISSLFNNAPSEPRTSAPETITLSLPPSALAGQGVVVRWTHSNGDGAYAYALVYSCATGLSFKAPTPAGTEQTVPCDTPFNFMSATSSMTITPAASSTATTTITVLANKLSTGQITASSRGTLEVRTAASATKPKPASTTSKPSTSKPTSKSVSAGRTTGLYGMPDLAVYITSVTSIGGNATVQFTVENVGTNVAPAGWSFNAILPINGSYTYPAGAQQALYPGGKIAFTLAYGDYDSGYGYGSSFSTCNNYGPCNIPNYPYGYPNYPYQPTYGYTGSYLSGYPYNTYPYSKSVTVTVDPYNQVYDLNRSNNSATMPYTPR